MSAKWIRNNITRPIMSKDNSELYIALDQPKQLPEVFSVSRKMSVKKEQFNLVTEVVPKHRVLITQRLNINALAYEQVSNMIWKFVVSKQHKLIVQIPNYSKIQIVETERSPEYGISEPMFSIIWSNDIDSRTIQPVDISIVSND